MYRTICLIPLLSLLLSTQDATARNAGGPTGPRLVAPPAPRREPVAAPAPASQEARYYADSFLPLRDDVRAFERDPTNRYTYCIRNVATYECLSYAGDGSLRRRQNRATAHGTGFAYKLDGEDTRLVTNEHVVAWPFVTDADHSVEDVPLGCKLVSQKLSIVDNEDDEYEADDIPLTRVIDDRALDVAVVRAKGKLALLPYRIGRSSELSAGDVVIVRGFPLGVFQAYNTGKIINTRDEDRFKHWDHTDFIVDAQLSSGNSGSPVLALNRKSGEYELVGVFHASYTRGRSLNAVIAIEQIRDLMLLLKRGTSPGARLVAEPLLEPAQRARLRDALARQEFTPFIGLGALLVRLHSFGDTLLFEVYTKGFPLDDHRVALFVDSPVAQGFGRLEKAWFGDGRGYKSYGLSELGADESALLKRLMQRLYVLSSSTLSFREVLRGAPGSRQAVEQRTAFRKALSRAAAQDADLAQQLLDLAEEKSPAAAETALPLAAVLAQLEKAASPNPEPVSVASSAEKKGPVAGAASAR